MGEDGEEGGVVVACGWVGNLVGRDGRGKGPENASSGRTRRSRFWGEAASSRVFARATFSVGLPSSGASWRHAMRIFWRKVEDLGRWICM